MKIMNWRGRRWLTGVALASAVLAGNSASQAGIFFDQPPVTTVTPPTGVSPTPPETPPATPIPETPGGGPPPLEPETPLPPEVVPPVVIPPGGGTPPTSQTPEPGTMLLACTGVGLVGLRAWRRRK